MLGIRSEQGREKGDYMYYLVTPDYLHRPVATTTAEKLNEGNSNRGLECLFIRCHRPMFSTLESFGLLSVVVS